MKDASAPDQDAVEIERLERQLFDLMMSDEPMTPELFAFEEDLEQRLAKLKR